MKWKVDRHRTTKALATKENDNLAIQVRIMIRATRDERAAGVFTHPNASDVRICLITRIYTLLPNCTVVMTETHRDFEGHTVQLQTKVWRRLDELDSL